MVESWPDALVYYMYAMDDFKKKIVETFLVVALKGHYKETPRLVEVTISMLFYFSPMTALLWSARLSTEARICPWRGTVVAKCTEQALDFATSLREIVEWNWNFPILHTRRSCCCWLLSAGQNISRLPSVAASGRVIRAFHSGHFVLLH